MGKIVTDTFDFASVPEAGWPAPGSFIIGLDSADNKLKKLDSAGVLTVIGDGAAGTLAQTLALGNITGGNNIIISDGDFLFSADGSSGALTLDDGDGVYFYYNPILGVIGISDIPVSPIANTVIVSTASTFINHNTAIGLDAPIINLGGSFFPATAINIGTGAGAKTITMGVAGDTISLYGTGQLFDSSFGGILSLDWAVRSLYNSSGNQKLDWENAILYNAPSGLKSLDWNNRTLHYSDEDISIDYQNSTLYDSQQIQSVTWGVGTRQLWSSDGFVPLLSVDWGIRQLYQSGGDTVADWENQQLYSFNISSLNWVNRTLNGSDGAASLTWTTTGIKLAAAKYVTDTTDVASIDTNARVLIDAGGINPTVDWNSLFLYGDWSIDGNFSPFTDNTYDLGTPTEGWANLYLASNVHYTSDLLFKTGGVERVRFQTDGKVGIGTTSPNGILDVNGTFGASTAGIGIAPNLVEATLHVMGSGNGSGSSAVKVKNSDSGVAFEVINNLMCYFGSRIGVRTDPNTSTATFHVLGASGIQAMRVDTASVSDALIVSDNGRVGIGTSTPTSDLEIKNAGGVSLSIESAGGGHEFLFKQAGVTTGYIKQDPFSEYILYGATRHVYDRVNGTGVESFSITTDNTSGAFSIQDDSGNSILFAGTYPAFGTRKVGINNATPSAMLQVGGIGNTSATYVFKSQNSDLTDIFNIRDDSTLVTNANFLSISVNNPLTFTNNNGYIQIGPQNSGTCHIYTDLPTFSFNKEISLLAGVLSSPNAVNLSIQQNGETVIYIKQNTPDPPLMGIRTTSPNVLLDVNGDVAFRATSPGTITSNQDDYSVGESSNLRIATSASPDVEFSGFADGYDGKILIITNVGSEQFTIKHQSVSSAAANRVITGPGGLDKVMVANGSITMLYDSTTLRWRIISSNF